MRNLTGEPENPFDQQSYQSSDERSHGSGDYLYPENDSYHDVTSQTDTPNPSGTEHLMPQVPSRATKPYFDSNHDGASSRQHLVDRSSSSGSLAGMGGSMTPNGFDRYPDRISSVNIRSATASEVGSISENDDNPFVVNADFSPFGGYPASSFPLHIDEKEQDDYLHNPDPVLDQEMDKRCQCQKMDRRGISSLIAFILLIGGLIVVFIVLPILTYSGVTERVAHPVVHREVEVLSAYQFPQLSFRKELVDPDTPSSAMTHTADDGSKWDLVFSDEFNMEGRTFYPNDDPFWTAVDIHYAATKDLEWYDPDAAITENGTLVLQLDAFKSHDLYYRSGMVQSWNKVCFTQGYIEISASLPGQGRTPGLWPGLWTMGNLGRPGYLSTTDGVWPYGYNNCDAGITPNQSSTDGISYLPGQRLNKCTCKGEEHPNPGTGRGAPEIDALEGSVGPKVGVASQSLQVAPFDIWYIPDYNFIEIYNASVTSMNTYAGGMFQQAISGITMLNNDWYDVVSVEGQDESELHYQTFGFEYLNDDDKGYIKWFVGQDPTFNLHGYALGPNGNVGRRDISKEPMSIIMNLGLSNSWTYIDWPALNFPSKLRIDYVRIYQPSDQHSITCDPDDYPTYDYIEKHKNAYENANLTLWTDAGYTFPQNTLMHSCT
ncbi:beta-glucan synthesis-associated protein-domain-containing protein [Yarrowia lipolytica]|uniref:YALI0C14190p n=2 Tax=Yarrowia lipolytica TaxID=4952 RepID=Q6CBZ2_YARLI|nr:YALI0C14190p [Yarrowia lipolytica CLIB122]RDW25506.1 beta-glucan synthesis-associated protein-domain-containing protein [Yarrowia lipolytica]RDW34231.1 beta-glucan synthesis-associated protein-domain-containing protein [Yarrowia lipolytica]RDW37330.1 beta-glucan synthesis-associated protein-domain-containing protein [Yarrowia lipolytica]RDW44883.1 beta-glucan synthesis-associated protein-domain-containing protein [Yarrowia lipolytica]RDW49574.1 beta-glucan synthesis-associated protein-domai|eukprot:XP_501820.1 YALI0C14190p [Yarrowia lipolytica CLIB122]